MGTQNKEISINLILIVAVVLLICSTVHSVENSRYSVKRVQRLAKIPSIKLHGELIPRNKINSSRPALHTKKLEDTKPSQEQESSNVSTTNTSNINNKTNTGLHLPKTISNQLKLRIGALTKSKPGFRPSTKSLSSTEPTHEITTEQLAVTTEEIKVNNAENKQVPLQTVGRTEVKVKSSHLPTRNRHIDEKKLNLKRLVADSSQSVVRKFNVQVKTTVVPVDLTENITNDTGNDTTYIPQDTTLHYEITTIPNPTTETKRNSTVNHIHERVKPFRVTLPVGVEKRTNTPRTTTKHNVTKINPISSSSSTTSLHTTTTEKFPTSKESTISKDTTKVHTRSRYFASDYPKVTIVNHHATKIPGSSTTEKNEVNGTSILQETSKPTTENSITTQGSKDSSRRRYGQRSRGKVTSIPQDILSSFHDLAISESDLKKTYKTAPTERTTTKELKHRPAKFTGSVKFKSQDPENDISETKVETTVTNIQQTTEAITDFTNPTDNSGTEIPTTVQKFSTRDRKITNISTESTTTDLDTNHTTKSTGETIMTPETQTTHSTTESTEIIQSTHRTTNSTEKRTSTRGTTESPETSRLTRGTADSTETPKSTRGTIELTETTRSTRGTTESTETPKLTRGTIASIEIPRSTRRIAESIGTSKSTRGTTESTERLKSTRSTTETSETSKSTRGSTASTEPSTSTRSTTEIPEKSTHRSRGRRGRVIKIVKSTSTQPSVPKSRESIAELTTYPTTLTNINSNIHESVPESSESKNSPKMSHKSLRGDVTENHDVTTESITEFTTVSTNNISSSITNSSTNIAQINGNNLYGDLNITESRSSRSGRRRGQRVVKMIRKLPVETDTWMHNDRDIDGSEKEIILTSETINFDSPRRVKKIIKVNRKNSIPELTTKRTSTTITDSEADSNRMTTHADVLSNSRTDSMLDNTQSTHEESEFTTTLSPQETTLLNDNYETIISTTDVHRTAVTSKIDDEVTEKYNQIRGRSRKRLLPEEIGSSTTEAIQETSAIKILDFDNDYDEVQDGFVRSFSTNTDTELIFSPREEKRHEQIQKRAADENPYKRLQSTTSIADPTRSQRFVTGSDSVRASRTKKLYQRRLPSEYQTSANKYRTKYLTKSSGINEQTGVKMLNKTSNNTFRIPLLNDKLDNSNYPRNSAEMLDKSSRETNYNTEQTTLSPITTYSDSRSTTIKSKKEIGTSKQNTGTVPTIKTSKDFVSVIDNSTYETGSSNQTTLSSINPPKGFRSTTINSEQEIETTKRVNLPSVNPLKVLRYTTVSSEQEYDTSKQVNLPSVNPLRSFKYTTASSEEEYETLKQVNLPTVNPLIVFRSTTVNSEQEHETSKHIKLPSVSPLKGFKSTTVNSEQEHETSKQTILPLRNTLNLQKDAISISYLQRKPTSAKVIDETNVQNSPSKERTSSSEISAYRFETKDSSPLRIPLNQQFTTPLDANKKIIISSTNFVIPSTVQKAIPMGFKSTLPLLDADKIRFPPPTKGIASSSTEPYFKSTSKFVRSTTQAAVSSEVHRKPDFSTPSRQIVTVSFTKSVNGGSSVKHDERKTTGEEKVKQEKDKQPTFTQALTNRAFKVLAAVQQMAGAVIELPKQLLLLPVRLGFYPGSERKQREIPKYVDFPCKQMEHKVDIPESVHQLRPGDIKVVASLGDSYTTGNAALAENEEETKNNYRGVSPMGGGQATWRQYLTIPNILREFNPKLLGYALGTVESNNPISGLNVAENGALDDQLLQQAQSLVTKIRNNHFIDFNNDWKLVNIMIGTNDICKEYCFQHNDKDSPLGHLRQLEEALLYLKKNLPRTFVNLIHIPNMVSLQDMKNLPFTCHMKQVVQCSCLFGSSDKNKGGSVTKMLYGYWEAERRVVEDEKFDSEDFTVVLQPFFLGVKAPGIVSTLLGEVSDLNLFSPDCFHYNQKGNAQVANALWNNMMEPVGNKSLGWDAPFKRFICPTENAPYLFTRRNSQTFIQTGHQ
ncbi:hypothetical protein L9F63_007038 [Diploptera punctata]|uniref:Phospholipase B1, membrane-associated n=1 Tax=Diploptera punctata TaxID=6984 RepID=A0AAD8E3N1_DIPPU|nr:hypothetical protein L9F63_007038 [Diploptera punctata]